MTVSLACIIMSAHSSSVITSSCRCFLSSFFAGFFWMCVCVELLVLLLLLLLFLDYCDLKWNRASSNFSLPLYSYPLVLPMAQLLENLKKGFQNLFKSNDLPMAMHPGASKNTGVALSSVNKYVSCEMLFLVPLSHCLLLQYKC